ncbi:MAG: response regulator [Chloroflexota bacterium]
MSSVIVVDDDPTNAGLLKMLLELDGFTVHSCADIEQALEATTENISAYVIDINLARGVSGLDLLTKIREGETNAKADCVVVMSSGDYRREEESLELGASTFLLKPYSPDVLSTTLNNLLA